MLEQSDSNPAVLILGIGNVLWADEGFGVRAVEGLHRRYQFPAQVQLLDGGTQGIYLVQYVQTADILVIFDAIDFGLRPGTLKLLYDTEVPSFLGAKKISLHQTGFQEVLALAELLGSAPRHILLIGVQPVELDDYGGSLRPALKAQLPAALDAALNYLAGHGIQARQRVQPLTDDLLPQQLALEAYENGRPDPASAYRQGDPRVLGSPAAVFDPKPALANSLSVQIDRRRQD